MTDPQPKPVLAKPPVSPWMAAFIVLLVTVISFGVAQVIGLFVAFGLYKGTPDLPFDAAMLEFAASMENPEGDEQMRPLLWVAQAITTVVGLAVFPFIFWWSMRRRSLMTFFTTTPVRPIHFLLLFGIVVFFAGVTSVLVEWNSNIDLPGGVGQWMREMEDKAMELTKFMTSFSNVNQYLVALLVMAVFAGFSEELAFRGLLQTELQKAFRNHHAAIWVSAFFFSALHLQFYGFIPRMVLGAMFGYLYYWSGNLIVPMFAHFVHNGLTVTLIYFGFTDLPGTEGSTETFPWYGVVLSGLICAGLVYYYRSLHPKPAAPDDLPA